MRSGDATASLITVVTGSPEAGEVTSLAEAVRRVADGGTIELAYDGVRREDPIGIAGRHVTIRPALGRRPLVEFSGMRASEPDGPPVACDVGDGTLVLRGVSLRIADTASTAMRPVLFGIRSGRLTCDDVILGMPGSHMTARPLAGQAPAFVAVTAEGTRAEPLDVECDLDGVVIACGAGVVSLGDSSDRPVPARLRVRAADSRVIVDAGRPFIEQYGDADIDAYRTACQWIDRRSNYEGGGAFRRIEASTERVDEPIRDVAPPLFHQVVPGPRPDPASWAGAGG